MKVKTTELIDSALDWAVAKCEGIDDFDCMGVAYVTDPDQPHFSKVFRPSTDWSQGGPIIERECIDLVPGKTQWFSHGRIPCYGPTPLIAAMRCYVASKLGDEVEIPDDLIAS